MVYTNTNTTANNNAVAVLTQVATNGVPLMIELFTRIYSPELEKHKEDTKDLYSEHLDSMIADWRRKEDGDEGTTSSVSAAEIKEMCEEKKPVLQANDDLKSAIEYLKKAKENNPCGVCKPKIEDAEKYVEEKTKEIIRAGEIYAKMEELQSTGVIAEKPWRELTEDEKDRVRRELEA